MRLAKAGTVLPGRLDEDTIWVLIRHYGARLVKPPPRPITYYPLHVSIRSSTLSVLRMATTLSAAHNRTAMLDSTTLETVRDLMQCVQAARDGVPDGSLFGMQCEIVLQRAEQLFGYAAIHRCRQRPDATCDEPSKTSNSICAELPSARH